MTDERRYLHLITMKTAYADGLVYRDPILALSPYPDTIFFPDQASLEAWAREKGLEIVEYDFKGLVNRSDRPQRREDERP